MKILRYLVFLPISIFAIGLIYYLFGLLSSWFFSLSTVWLIVVAFFLGGMIWGLFSGISATVMSLLSKVSPSSKFALWTIAILSIIYGLLAITAVWSNDIIYSGKPLFAAIGYTVLVIMLTSALITGSVSAVEE